jgi:recombination protein RecT
MALRARHLQLTENNMSNAIAIVSGAIQEARESFAAVLTDRSLNFEREAGFAVQVLSANDYALKIATSNRQSVIDAVTNIAAIGISLNPAKKQAYLVPRDGRICLDISYIGLMDLAIASGSIRWGQASWCMRATPSRSTASTSRRRTSATRSRRAAAT